jgi:hypothetical protein
MYTSCRKPLSVYHRLALFFPLPPGPDAGVVDGFSLVDRIEELLIGVLGPNTAWLICCMSISDWWVTTESVFTSWFRLLLSSS